MGELLKGKVLFPGNDCILPSRKALKPPLSAFACGF